MYYTKTYDSPIGTITLASDGEHLVGLWLDGQKYFGQSIEEEMTECRSLPVFDIVTTWLDRYFANEQPAITELPLLPKGGSFRQDVWKILCEIPYGSVITYGDIAKKMAVKLGKETMSAQAIGGAVGHNPISIIIPCHRVVGTNGSLTGYAGGIDIKRKLLEHEGLELSNYFMPKK